MSDEGIVFDSTIDGKDVKLKLVQENIDIERKCDTEYHLAYTELMARGIMPRATLEKRMADKGIWSKDEEEQLVELQTQLAKLQIDLEGANTHEQGLKIASEMGNLRAECLKLVEVKAAVLSNSCESLADQIRRDAYLAYATVYADTGNKVFADYEDFIKRATEQCVVDAREAMLALATKSFNASLTGLPEVNYVKQVEGEIETDAEKAPAKKAPARKKTTKKTTKKKTTRKAAAKRG